MRRANKLIRRIIYLLLGCISSETWMALLSMCAKRRFVQSSLWTLKVRILPQKGTSLLHRKSHVHPFVDISSDGGMLLDKKLGTPWAMLTSEWRLCFNSNLQPCCQAMLKRHGCRAISVPLGAYGALSEWLSRTQGFKVISSKIAIEDE